MNPIPFEEIVNPATGRMKPRKVDIKSETYECARRYMIRLEKSDFVEPQLSRLATVAGMSAEQFKRRFGHVAGL
jgi:6-phosphofructokinase 1